MIDGYLVLEDGTIIEGKLFGAMTDKAGEVVFTTGGVDSYQDLMTDPANKGQLLVFSYPCIGNFGMIEDCNQSDKVQVNGIIVNEVCLEPSSQYGGVPLDEYMAEKGVTGITGIDTRDLIFRLRGCGIVKGAIVRKGSDTTTLLEDLKGVSTDSLASFISRKEVKTIDGYKEAKIGVLDLGVRKGLIDELSKEFDIVIFPYNTDPKEIVKSGVKGLVISSGPGNPNDQSLAPVVDCIGHLKKKMPIYGIGLGCELIAVESGAKVDKMVTGHHGTNYPVKIGTKVCMTSQSHNYCIDKESVNAKLICEQVNLNDGTVEFIRYEKLPVYGSEYDPFGVPGPSDALASIQDFYNAVKAVDKK